MSEASCDERLFVTIRVLERITSRALFGREENILQEKLQPINGIKNRIKLRENNRIIFAVDI